MNNWIDFATWLSKFQWWQAEVSDREEAEKEMFRHR